MASTIQQGDLARALGKAGATFVAHIGPNATTTTIPLADLNLGSNNLAGDLVLIQAGALGSGSVDTLAVISSNTSTSLTVSSALSAAPAAGYAVWIYRIATIQADVAENIAQVGGQNVPGNPIGSTGASAPSIAILSGGTDGTDLRAMKTDANGVLEVQGGYTETSPGSVAPTRAVQVAGVNKSGDLAVPIVGSDGAFINPTPSTAWWLNQYSAAANTNLLSTAYTPPQNGRIAMRILIPSGGTAATFSVIETPSTTPSTGGSTTASTGLLDGGNSLAVGSWYEFTIDVLAQCSYNLQTSIAQTITWIGLFRPE